MIGRESSSGLFGGAMRRMRRAQSGGKHLALIRIPAKPSVWATPPSKKEPPAGLPRRRLSIIQSLIVHSARAARSVARQHQHRIHVGGSGLAGVQVAAQRDPARLEALDVELLGVVAGLDRV